MITLRVLLLLVLLALPASARDVGQWGSADPRISQWFRSLMLPDNPTMSCCGEADAFEADDFEIEGDHYIAIVTSGKDGVPEGSRIPVPNFKMKFDAGNPTGHGIIFLGSESQRYPGDKRPFWEDRPGMGRLIYCYITPGGI